MRRKLLAVLSGGLLLAAVGATVAAPVQRDSLVEALRDGGFVIYFRHAATDWSQTDRVAGDGAWKSCDPTRMRQLSTAGREAARRIGTAIRGLEIPVSRVLSSEYCRAKETAELLSLGPVETTREIMNLRSAEYVGGREAAVERARRFLGTAPEPGTNTVIVAHGNLIRAATGVYPGEAGAAVFRPQPNGRPELFAEVPPDMWRELAERHGEGQ